METFENEHLNLEYTLECGQTFRWKKMADGFYYGVAGDTFVRIRQVGKRFFFETAPEPANYATVARYFQLDRDEEYKQIIQLITVDPHVKKAVSKYYGLRLLRQPTFETLISFILSANNKIPVVARTVQAISKAHGQPIILERYRGYTFPEAATLAKVSEAELETELGAEYRAKYILQTSTRIATQAIDLESLRELPYDWAAGQLTAFPGVGRTVADCVLLFSLGKYEAFPLDSWVQRLMEKLYFGGQKTSPKEIHLLAGKKWGEYAGYANEYLYMYARSQG